MSLPEKNKILYVILLHWHLIALKCITLMLYGMVYCSVMQWRSVSSNGYDEYLMFAHSKWSSEWVIFWCERAQARTESDNRWYAASTATPFIQTTNVIALKVFYQNNGGHTLICTRLSFLCLIYIVLFLLFSYLNFLLFSISMRYFFFVVVIIISTWKTS